MTGAGVPALKAERSQWHATKTALFSVASLLGKRPLPVASNLDAPFLHSNNQASSSPGMKCGNPAPVIVPLA
jgi:hypothetical protein